MGRILRPHRTAPCGYAQKVPGRARSAGGHCRSGVRDRCIPEIPPVLRLCFSGNAEIGRAEFVLSRSQRGSLRVCISRGMRRRLRLGGGRCGRCCVSVCSRCEELFLKIPYPEYTNDYTNDIYMSIVPMKCIKKNLKTYRQTGHCQNY